MLKVDSRTNIDGTQPVRDRPLPHVGVYLVEDQALIRECLRAMLDLEPNLEVVGESAEAEPALQELNHLDVDVVLMDIKLPGLSGLDVISRLIHASRALRP